MLRTRASQRCKMAEEEDVAKGIGQNHEQHVGNLSKRVERTVENLHVPEYQRKDTGSSLYCALDGAYLLDWSCWKSARELQEFTKHRENLNDHTLLVVGRKSWRGEDLC